MQRTTLLNALPIVASVLGRKYGVAVEIGGRDALTNGQRIILPALPVDDQKAALLAYGYLDHEAGHVRLTDFTAVQPDLTAASPLKHQLWNIFEDIRIEQAMGQMFPGCRINLDRLTRQLVADGVFEVPSEAEPVKVLQSCLLYTLRSSVLGQQALTPLALICEDLLSRLFSLELRVRLSMILGKVRGLRSTRDALRLADEVIELLEQELQAPEPSGMGEQSQDSSNNEERAPCSGLKAELGPTDIGRGHEESWSSGRESSGAQGLEDQPKGSQAEQEQSPNDTPRSGSPEETTENDELEPSSVKGNFGGPIQDANRASAVQDEMTGSGGLVKSIATDQGALRQILTTGSSKFSPDFGSVLSQQLQQSCGKSNDYHSKNVRVALVEPPPEGTSAQGQALIAEVKIQTRALLTRLEALVQAFRQERSRLSLCGKQIDTRELHRLAVSDLQVFSTLRRRQTVNTAVQIVLDASSSMKDSRIEVARRSALAAALALQSIPGTAVNCVAFGKKHHVTVLTCFGERVEPTAPRYAAIEAEGSTPLAEALWWYATALLFRQEERKILLVITDGEPNDRNSARDVIQRYLNSGIEAIGLGIELPLIEGLFPTSEIINSVQQLPNALFRLLEQALTRHSALRTA
ncbi:MAG: VWA domain-containing protein [Acidobacteria bacterium]|nr:VWA domain-containing protein [Acidobacteriota bacterium]